MSQSRFRSSAQSGATRAAFLHFAGGGDPCLCLVTPAVAAGSLDESFEALLARAPQPMALTSPKGVILAANDAFRALFLGNARRIRTDPPSFAASRWRCWSRTRPRKNVRDRIASLGERWPWKRSPSSCRPRSKAAMAAASALSSFRRRMAAISSSPQSKSGAAALGGEDAVQSQKLQAVGELAGGIAHDFNNLLTAIIGHSDLLLRRFRASDSAFKDVMNIKGSATRAAELVKQILAYSRRQTLRPAILRLTDVIEEFQANMGRTLGEKVKADGPAWPRPVVRKGRRGPDFPGNHEPRGQRARRHAATAARSRSEPRM